jgi:menaquinone-9 beta-reductase
LRNNPIQLIYCGLIVEFDKDNVSRDLLEKHYQEKWHSLFTNRLWAGRQIQNLFGSEWASNLAVNLARYSKPVANFF